MDKKKTKLILGQQKTEPKEGMKFRDENRPHRDVEKDLAAKKTPFKKVEFPNLSPTEKEEYGSYEDLLASEEYQHALEKLRRMTGHENVGQGIEGNFMTISQMGLAAALNVMEVESAHKEELEKLCEEIVREEFAIPEGAVQFNLNLASGTDTIKPNAKESKKQESENVEEVSKVVEDINTLTLEEAKRRILNAMTHGSSVEDMDIIELDSIRNKIKEIINMPRYNIYGNYGAMICVSMLGYWHFPNKELNKAMGGEGEGLAAGKSRVDNSTNPPTIYAEAVAFPFLVHEAIKGIMTFFSREVNPQNPELYQQAKENADTMESEIWDIRLGPEIWRRWKGILPKSITVGNPENPKVLTKEQKGLQHYLYVNVVNLPAHEFLALMKEVMGKTPVAERLMAAMLYDVKGVLGEHSIEDSYFRKEMDDFMKNAPPKEEDNVQKTLGQLGLRFKR